MRKDTISYVKGLSNKKNLTILNIYTPNMGAANYINQLITKSKKHIENNTIIAGDFKTSLTEMDISFKQRSTRK